jgi:hypothetical protein
LPGGATGVSAIRLRLMIGHIWLQNCSSFAEAHVSSLGPIKRPVSGCLSDRRRRCASHASTRAQLLDPHVLGSRTFPPFRQHWYHFAASGRPHVRSRFAEWPILATQLAGYRPIIGHSGLRAGSRSLAPRRADAWATWQPGRRAALHPALAVRQRRCEPREPAPDVTNQ